MKLYYRPKDGDMEYDITEDALVEEARAADRCGGRRDGLEIGMSGAGLWKTWAPQPDDMIRATLDGYDTGRMYVSAVYPEGDTYRIYASGCPSMARVERKKSWRGETLRRIAEETAAYCQMEYALYGIEGDIRYPYMAQRTGCEKFAERLATLEGGRVKAYDGRMIYIGTEWAQEQTAAASLTIQGETDGVYYLLRGDMGLCAVTVRTPWGEGTAWDAARTGKGEIVIDLPARSAAEARRWARGILLRRNQGAETLEMETEFNPAYTAMARVDISGDQYAAGEWLIEEATHDLIHRRSEIKMVRTITTIR